MSQRTAVFGNGVRKLLARPLARLIQSPGMLRTRLTALFFYVLTPAPITLFSLPALADGDYYSVIARQEEQVLYFLRTFETLQEQLHPAKFTQLQAELSQAVGDQFAHIRSEFEKLTPPPERKAFHETWFDAVGLLYTTYGIFVRKDSNFIGVFIQSRDTFARARFLLYDIRHYTPTLQQYWVLPDVVADLPALEESVAASEHEVGILHHQRSSEHGAYSLYVPENYVPERHWPLIIALHGGSGANDEYLLTWLRAAKSNGYFILSPKSLGPTWAVDNPDADVLSITAMLTTVGEQYAIDSDRILVSGLSDGGTFSYALATSRPDLFAAVAPIAAVLAPWLDLQKAKALPFLIIHGGQDFIFPVRGARMANATLVENGFAEVTYKELPEWGHAYTYSINQELILPWFEGLFE